MRSTLNDQKYYIVYIRAMLSLSIILLAMYNYEIMAQDMLVSSVFIALIVISNFLFIYIPAKYYSGVRLHYIIFMMDISFIVIASHIYTQLDIQFVLAVFLTIFIAALSQSVKLSIVIALVVNAVYLYLRYISGGEGYNLFTEKTLLNIPYIFIVALHSSYLAEKANVELKEKEELEKVKDFLTGEILTKNSEINSVKKFAYDLLSSLNEAVIIFDLSGNLRMANEKAVTVLGIKNHNVINTPFSGLELPAEVKDIVMNAALGGETADERAVNFISAGTEKKGVINCGFIKDRSGQKLGLLLTAREVLN